MDDTPPIDNDAARLTDQWKGALELRNDQYRTFDRAILAVSGGALAVSIANVDKLSGGGSFSELLLVSWLAFGVAIASNVASYWTSTRDNETEMEKIRHAVENSTSYEVGNVWRSATYILNFAALAMIIVGIICLSAHAYTHLRGPNVVKISEPAAPDV